MQEGNRFAPITDNDHSGYLWIVSILCLIYSPLIILARIYMRWHMYGADDATALAATVMQFGQVISLILALKHGLGKSQEILDSSSIEHASKETFTSQIFLIVALALAKGSVAALMLRLFTRDMKATRKSWVFCNVTVILIIAWCIGSLAAISISCTPSQFLHNSQRNCPHQSRRWQAITAVNIFTELMLMLLPILFIWPVQMKRHIKFQVAIAFGFRLPAVGFAAAHLHYVSVYTKSSNIPMAIVPALLYQQCELFWSLLAATIPTLKAFMRSFNSGFGMEMSLDGYGYGYGSGSTARKHRNGSVPLQSLENATAASGEGAARFGTGESRAENGRQEAGSPMANGSQELIIQREVEWSIYTE